MAAGEDQPQLVVRHARLVSAGAGLAPPARASSGSAARSARAGAAVDRLEPPGRHQPRARDWPARLARPLLERRRRRRRAAPPRPGRSRPAGGSAWRARAATRRGRPPRPARACLGGAHSVAAASLKSLDRARPRCCPAAPAGCRPATRRASLRSGLDQTIAAQHLLGLHEGAVGRADIRPSRTRTVIASSGITSAAEATTVPSGLQPRRPPSHSARTATDLGAVVEQASSVVVDQQRVAHDRAPFHRPSTPLIGSLGASGSTGAAHFLGDDRRSRVGALHAKS